MSTKDEQTPQTHSFQAEVQQLLQLMIHSLYSNKEIFLRELISNASDACDKLRFAALTDKSLLEEEEALGIWVSIDEKQKTITIRDNGIGMTHEEVITDIGTIARSGTKAFLEKMSKENSADSRFIGQFGVGFYSSFLVAKEVTLITRKAGQSADKGVKWVSDGSGEYTLEYIDRPQRGTEITITLNKDDKEYAEKFRVRNVISKYSDHISLPIYTLKDPELDDKGEKKKEANPEWETINQGSALWARPKKDITKEEYNSFYTSLTYDTQPPALVLHNRVEGRMEYISLFYIPGKAPFDLWDKEQRHGIKLYVRRIFISDDTKTLMPKYLRFVKGLVDSADLPLNVSREFLQQNKAIDKIRSASVKKVLTELTNLVAKDLEKYHALWNEYGRVLKEGILEDFENKDTLTELMRFSSTHNKEEAQTISLQDYIDRMPEKQQDIYYITAESHAAAKSSPHLEVFRKNDLEVLLLSDPVDEWVVGHLTEYQGKKLKSISKGELDLNELTSKPSKKENEEKESKPLIEKMTEVLKDQVKEVKISDRLVDSPCCLVADSNDLGGNMERILKAIGQDAPTAKPILEINPDHALIKQLDIESETFSDWAKILFEQAALTEGATLKDPHEFVKRMNQLLIK